MPVAEGDFAIVAAAGGAHRAALLLSAVDPIGEAIVGDHVIELRGRLVVPGAPGLAAVQADGGTLVGCQQDDAGVVGVDPDGVIIVAAGRAFDGGETGAAIDRAVGGGVGDVDDVLVFGIDAHAGEIGAAPPDALVVVDALPVGAGVVGSVDTALLGRIHQRVHAARIAGRDGDADAAQAFGGTVGSPPVSGCQVLPPSVDLNSPLPGPLKDSPISQGACRAAHSTA